MGHDAFHIEAEQTPEQKAALRAQMEAITEQMRAENGGEIPRPIAAAHVAAIATPANSNRADGLAEIRYNAPTRIIESDRLKRISDCPVLGC